MTVLMFPAAYVLILWAVCFIVHISGEYEHLLTKYQSKFDKVCAKYSFIQRYNELMKEKPDRYIIYVFHDNHASTSGLGDRIAGMITAMAYSLRFRRIFLIQGDAAFEKSFKPYFYANESDDHYAWHSWDWSGWKKEFADEVSSQYCINPRPGRTVCALDHDSDVRVLKYYSNRSYLCRWLTKSSLNLQEDLLNSLNITLTTNLFEVAGCFLRLAMYPTKSMWKTILSLQKVSLVNRKHFETTATTNSSISSSVVPNSAASSSSSHLVSSALQVGVHFRCGDSSFSSSSAIAHTPNPRCVYSPDHKWEGTLFLDEISMESPLDLARCAQKKANEYSLSSPSSSIELTLNSSPISVLIASDNRDTSKQIIHHLSHNLTLFHPPSSCHIDFQKSHADCSLSTLSQWFLLSLSDMIITQSALKYDMNTLYTDNEEMKYLQDPYPKQIAPISAFSRYALIYGLSSDHLYYGNCTDVNVTTIGHSTHGNWVCTTKIFF
jgi:hypothetical protein